MQPDRAQGAGDVSFSLPSARRGGYNAFYKIADDAWPDHATSYRGGAGIAHRPRPSWLPSWASMWALPWSTVVLSLLILIYGLVRYVTTPFVIPFLISGVGGIVITVWALVRYRARSDALSQLQPRRVPRW